MAAIQEQEGNGVNVGQLFDTIEQIKQNPDLARFQFRARNKWVAGTRNRVTVQDFYGALMEDSSRVPMEFDIDEPPVLCGKNLGANPVEYLLAALSGCLTTSIVAHAAARGIVIRGIQSRYEGDIDLRGFLGISEEVPVGYQEIRMFFTIDADLSGDEKRELIEMGKKYSPVYNTIRNPTAVRVELDAGTA